MFRFYTITTLFASEINMWSFPVPASTQATIDKGEAQYGAMPLALKILGAQSRTEVKISAFGWAALSRQGGLDVAADQLEHFLGNTGKTYTNYPVARMLGEDRTSPQSKNFISYMNKLRIAAECYAAPNKAINVCSRTEAGFNLSGSDKNWALSLGYYRFYIDCYVIQTGSNQYLVEDGYYFIRDYYDWDSDVSSADSILNVAIPRLWELHYAGEARNYNVTGWSWFRMYNWQGGAQTDAENWTWNYQTFSLSD